MAGDHKLTDDQQEQKQAALTEAESDYESAKVAEAAALQTSLDKDEAAARAAHRRSPRRRRPSSRRPCGRIAV